MTALADAVVARLHEAFEPNRNLERAEAMSAYMRGQFRFIGIGRSERVRLSREAAAGLGSPSAADLAAVASACWRLHEREYQYAAVWYLRRNVRVLSPGFVGDAERLITTKPWWDTVDDLAANVVGDLVRRHPDLRRETDRWIGSEDVWLVRAAILHQLRHRADTDVERLFAYCLRRADHRDFFIRKAIGWALREYSKIDADAVQRFLRANDAALSGLSKREALKWLERVGR